MIDAKNLFLFLKKNQINFFAGVPDSVLKNFIYILNSNKKKIRHIITANEGNAVALAAGNYLATKKPALVYMQNSGLGNAINPLISICHSKVYSIPLILMIGWRGSPKENDEPQHQLKGKITPSILKLLNIKFSVLNNFRDLKKLKNLINYSKYKKRPVAFLIKNNTLSLDSNFEKDNKSKNYLTREAVINVLLNAIKKNTRIISTTGYTSRELFQIRKDKKYKNGKDFYMVGGMGHASMTSLGYSLSSKNQVICLDGDGSVMMHLGALISTGFKAKKNFKHILLNNGSHDSVGKQKIDTLKVDFKKIVKSFNYKKYYYANNNFKLKKELISFLNSKGPSFFEIIIDNGTIKNLSRPKNLIDIKKNFLNS
jgi:phosphonopyruvate decarboxylase